MPEPLRLLVLGAHPDDAEFGAGGIASIYRKLGHAVKMISLTSGDAGHHEMSGPPLAARRRAEAAASGRVIGAEYITWDNHDGELVPTLELRWQVIREIRTFKPDLVITHRPDDYHPDHRAVGHVVRDASYMVTVPPIVPDAPILRRDPVVAYMYDGFTKPYPLQPDVVIDIGEHVDTVTKMLDAHVSQMYEWLPYNRRELEKVPKGDADRRAWLKEWYVNRLRKRADRFRQRVVETYEADRGNRIEYIDVFEISEYAAPLDAEARRRLFPFVP
jgi:LmbE family N-acetylglucosaminyl deacetylase